jgi:hypothetical protein
MWKRLFAFIKMSLSAFFREIVYSKTKSLETRWLEYNGGKKTLEEEWNGTHDNIKYVVARNVLEDRLLEPILFIFVWMEYNVDTCMQGTTFLIDMIKTNNIESTRILLVLGANVIVKEYVKLVSRLANSYSVYLNIDVYDYARNDPKMLRFLLMHRKCGYDAYQCRDLKIDNIIDNITNVKHHTITLLALKRRRIRSMGHLDRFLMRDLALQIWCERINIL